MHGVETYTTKFITEYSCYCYFYVISMEYRVTQVVACLGCVDLDLDFYVPLSAGFCLGRWEFDRAGWGSGQDDGTSISKSTQPR